MSDKDKAAPVGEREAFLLWLGIKPCGAAHDLAWDAWKAGAAHQRQQAREVVMPGRAVVSVRYGYRSMGYAEGWNDCIDEVISLNKGAGSHE